MKTTLDQMLFPVEMALISEKLNIDAISSTEYGIFANVDNKTILLNTCSENYELLPNANLFPVIETMLNNAGIEYTVDYKMIDYSRFYAEYNIKTGGITVGNKSDQIFPTLRVDHSYNGLLKYKMTFGYFRLICSNGLVIPVEGMEESNITIVGKHTSKILKSLESLLDKIEYFNKNNGKFSNKFQEVSERWVEKWEERVEAVIEATGIGKRGYDQITSKIKEEAQLLNNGRVNDWLIYNGINYHIFNAITSQGKEYATAPNLRRDADKKVWDTIYKYPTLIPTKKESILE